MWLPDNRTLYNAASHPARPYMFTDDLVGHTQPFFDKMNEQQRYDDGMVMQLAGLSDKAGPMQTEILRQLYRRFTPSWADTQHGMGVMEMKNQDAALSPSTVPAVPGAAPMVPKAPPPPQPFQAPNLFDTFRSPALAPPPREVSPTIQTAAAGSASAAPPVKVGDLGTMGPLGDAITKLIGGNKTPSLLEQTINDPTPMFGRDYLRGLKKDQDLADKTDTDQALRGLGLEMKGLQAQAGLDARERAILAAADRLDKMIAIRESEGEKNRKNQRDIAGGSQATRREVAGKTNEPSVLDVLDQLNKERVVLQAEVARLGHAFGERVAPKKDAYIKAVKKRDEKDKEIEAVKKKSGLFILP